uniref:Uncharacterized protein n=1 Tax=Avena sativa TaxID=4498 RepID=A0ACD5ZG70_AVESA
MSALALGAWRERTYAISFTRSHPPPPGRVAARNELRGVLPRGAKLDIAMELSAAPSAQEMISSMPPGPRSLPFIGSLHHLLTLEPQVALRELARKHGPVMYLRLGQVDTVVISSPAAAQEVLRDNDINFASRPSLLAAEIMGYGYTDIVFSPYGAYWKMLRKLCSVELLSSRKVRHFAPVRDGETLSLVRTIAAASRSGEPVNLATLLQSCANSITAKAAFGEEVCDAKLRQHFLSAMEVGVSLGGGFCVGDLFPSLWFMDVVTGLKPRLWQARRKVDAVFDTIIAGCEARREENKKTGATTQDNDLLSVILRIRDEGDPEFPITTTNIKAIILDMFVAGTETTSTSAEWILSELVRNPEMMAKAQAEVRRTLDGKSSEDHELHITELHYTRMVVKEGMRLHPALPLLVPRACQETCEVGGFKVIKGSRVMINAWAIARDPEYWHDAEEFRPQRFEERKVDYQGTQFEYLPFGSGRRVCPGSNFGMAMLELIVARLLYYFDWSLPSGIQPHELDMDMIVGMTSRRRNPLHLIATPYI